MTEPFQRTDDGAPICPFCGRESDTDEFETHMCWGHDHMDKNTELRCYGTDTHLMCDEARGHNCQKPSGRLCVEAGCGRAAGTLWGPYWCPDHDAERLDRIGKSLEEIAASFSREGSPS